jgi:acetolactate synthase I/III small subunit
MEYSRKVRYHYCTQSRIYTSRSTPTLADSRLTLFFPNRSTDDGTSSIPKPDTNAAYVAHTISIVVMNKPGVLDVITGVFARRGYNVQSLGVGPEKTFDISRISTVVPGTYEDVSKLLKQILKVPYVISAEDITKTPYVERELMLIKVVCPRQMRGELVDMCDIFRGHISDVSEDTVTIEVAGKVSKITAMQSLLEPYGILEVARSGRVALPRDSGVDSKLLAAIEDEGDLEFM